MARFFSHRDITGRQSPHAKDLQWLAGQIARLPPFQDGCAVLCGSISWGAHSWRSDIDVAHFSTEAHPHLEAQIKEVIERFVQKSAAAFIAPRVDLITIGVESPLLVTGIHPGSSGDGALAGTAFTEVSNADLTEQPPAQMFAETVVRFSDHIGALAHLKGGTWARFLERYLSSPDGSPEKRRAAIKTYLSAVMSAWEEQPLHALNFEDGDFTQRQLDLISQAENFPTHLMRRILGELGRYPRPDRTADVHRAFAELTQPWAKQLLADSAPFLALDAQYEQLIADCRRAANAVSAAEYQDRVRGLVDSLPFSRIQEATWQYLESRAG